MSDQVFSLAALTVLELSPPDMVDVAARAGYSHVGLRLEPATPEEHHFPLVADAQLRRQTRQRLSDTGIKVLDIEILRLKPQTQVMEFRQILEVGAEFGASELLVAGNDPDEARLSDNFAALCDLAGPYGIYPHLEFMPWTDARDLTQALRIVEQAGRRNASVLIDAFHFNRSGSSLAELAAATAEAPQRFRYAQLCDVAGPRPDDMAETLRQARNERRFPGDGDCDLHGLLNALPAQIPLSLEIPTRQLLEQGVSAYDRAKLALDKARQVLHNR
ncbi:Xylose isomerase-like enzyme [Pseudomonas reidholzensis]|uniref:Xylose isomerase-like enzyme n=1 Tax=Pseudomonas reidholzensis TaxID=1785162 RepID=A0A383RUW7_9PSED|nr:sugar phosphate isomerase/epimerase [Pseudomonas reidholzensis]SYX90178.1 Xylose isomerase-like enzyme [Pseudomonas reidholzensis]